VQNGYNVLDLRYVAHHTLQQLQSVPQSSTGCHIHIYCVSTYAHLYKCCRSSPCSCLLRTPSSATESLAVGTVQLSIVHSWAFLNAMPHLQNMAHLTLYLSTLFGDPIGDKQLGYIWFVWGRLPSWCATFLVAYCCYVCLYISASSLRRFILLFLHGDGYVSWWHHWLWYYWFYQAFCALPDYEALTLHGLLAGPSIFISILLCLYLLFITFPRPLIEHLCDWSTHHEVYYGCDVPLFCVNLRPDGCAPPWLSFTSGRLV
jgi:hypothetical protein